MPDHQVYPKLSNDYTAVPPSAPRATAPSPPIPSIDERPAKTKNSYAPSLLRVFALVHFCLLLLFVLSRRWSRDFETPVIAFMTMQFMLLLGSLFQGICVLILVTIATATLLVFTSTAILIVPMIIASFYACGMRNPPPFPAEFRLAFVTEAMKDIAHGISDIETLRMIRGFEYGFDTGLILFAFFILTLLQLSFVYSALNLKLSLFIQKKLDDESKRDAVTIYEA